MEHVPSPLTHSVVPAKTGYDLWAEHYDGEDNPLILLENEHLPQLLGPVSGLVVADIGCGTGRHALRLARSGAKVTAVDFSPAMLQRARAKSGADAVDFLLHDLAKPMPFPDAVFDRIVCCLMVEHVANLQSFFRELRRVCDPAGLALVSAMHPAMGLRGVEPRFIDPATGGRISPQSHRHQVSDYVMASLRAGWRIDHLSEHALDAALANRSPRGQKYVGWPLLLLLRLRAEHFGTCS